MIEGFWGYIVLKFGENRRNCLGEIFHQMVKFFQVAWRKVPQFLLRGSLKLIIFLVDVVEDGEAFPVGMDGVGGCSFSAHQASKTWFFSIFFHFFTFFHIFLQN
jgi:hypothetical protein